VTRSSDARRIPEPEVAFLQPYRAGLPRNMQSSSIVGDIKRDRAALFISTDAVERPHRRRQGFSTLRDSRFGPRDVAVRLLNKPIAGLEVIFVLGGRRSKPARKLCGDIFEMVQFERKSTARGSLDGVVASDTIRVYLAAASSLTARHFDLLSPEERTRAARFVFEKDRSLFVLGRAMLRSILGPALGLPGTRVPLLANASGKLEIQGCGGPGFNLSHSGVYVAVAVAAAGRVGVDIEVHRPDCGFLAIAREYFCPAELACLNAGPEHAEALFYRYWTLKEAHLKALGSGLSGPLRNLDVSRVRDGSVLENQWSFCGIGLQVLNAPPGYSAAVAADVGPWRACVEWWNPTAY
jgi:4'-phosphopantetheinyl transferase